MDKKLQDLAWSVLPKEFKKEVKDNYQELMSALSYFESKTSLNSEECNRCDLIRGKQAVYNKLFGYNNLTSDAEGEVMLTVPKSKVQEMYAHYDKICNDPNRPKDYIESIYEYADGVTIALDDLFGSKCLPDEACNVANSDVASSEPKPFKYSVGQKVILHFYGGEVSTITEAFNDGGVWNKYKVKMLPTHVWNENELDPYEEPKPAEPKYHVGQKVKFKGKNYGGFEVTTIEKRDDCDEYQYKLAGWKHPYRASDLEPYTEPEENVNHRQFIANCDKQFDNILKDSFSKERRLNIATQILSGIVASDKPYRHPVKRAIELTDALLAELDK